MRFACSTGVGIFVCENVAGDWRINGISRYPHAQAGSFYGISWLADGQTVVLGHSSYDAAAGIGDEQSRLRSERGWLSIGERNAGVPLAAPHQVTAMPDGRVLVANTMRNCLTIVEPDGAWRHHWFGDLQWDRLSVNGTEGSHINSVLVNGDRVFVLAHNHHRNSFAYVLDAATLSVMDHVHGTTRGCHNMWQSPDGLAVLSSATGELRMLESGESLWSSGDASGWLRGLAVGRDVILVGDTGRSVRGGRDAARGGVYVIDRQSMRTLDYVDLLQCGAVCEVRLLDESDACHGMGPFAGAFPIDEEITSKFLMPRRQTKLNRSANSLDLREWTLQDGAMMLSEGYVCAYPSILSLATRNLPAADASPDGTVSAEVRGSPTPLVQLVGLVARYQGPGDARMYVAMVEFYDGNAVLKLLVSDGKAWRSLFVDYLGRAPSYRLAYSLAGHRHRLVVDGAVRADLVDDTLADGQFGVRLNGGRFTDWHFAAAAAATALAA